MKKSYHSNVVPTTVAATTRRRSRRVMPPLGVAAEVSMRAPAGCRDVGVWRRGDVSVVVAGTGSTVAPRIVIVYDFGYMTRARELMTTPPAPPAHVTDDRFAALPCRPGKIVAVHLSYASRAEQRGRRPAHPSYFLKPSSSVAASGGTVERPAGTELLAFEGEIALVIGTEARRVPLADAWRHVGWVTAANDLGVYDLRANDKGSNVRSK